MGGSRSYERTSGPLTIGISIRGLDRRTWRDLISSCPENGNFMFPRRRLVGFSRRRWEISHCSPFRCTYLVLIMSVSMRRSSGGYDWSRPLRYIVVTIVLKELYRQLALLTDSVDRRLVSVSSRSSISFHCCWYRIGL